MERKRDAPVSTVWLRYKELRQGKHQHLRDQYGTQVCMALLYAEARHIFVPVRVRPN